MSAPDALLPLSDLELKNLRGAIAGHMPFACRPAFERLLVNVAELKAERDELQRVFDLRWKADMRAIKRWQAATGRTLTWPDHADLCVWLLGELEKKGKA